MATAVRALIVCACVCASSSASAEFGLGCLPEPPGALDGVSVYFKPPPPKPARPSFGFQPGQLPSSIDNSTQGCFPPIGNQGSQDSCSAWVTTYYYLSYLQRRDKGWSGGANSNLCSPAFTYNQLRSDDGGSVISDYMKMFTRIGACTLEDMPYVAADDNTQPGETDFRNAAEFRTLGFSYFVVTNDENVILLKQHLASTNIAVTSMNVYSNFLFAATNGATNAYRRSIVPTNANVMVAQSGGYEGGHAVTIVGYDDNRAYGTNASERGAFKLANSWGTNWASAGFFWVSYEYFKTKGTNLQWNNDNECFVMWDREGYTPKATMTIRVTHPCREQIRLAVGVVDPSEIYRYYYYGCAYAGRTNSTNSPYLYTYPGATTACPNLVLDVSELLHYTKDDSNTTWAVLLGDAWADGITGTVDYVKIESHGTAVETNIAVWINEGMTNGEDLGTQVLLDATINRPNPQALFVDNDHSKSGWYPDYSNYRCYGLGYEVEPLQSMTALAAVDSNMEFQAINRDTQTLSQATLNGYRTAFWLGGRYAAYANPTVCPISSADRRLITNYLAQGGRLFLEGEAVSPSLGTNDAFVTNWLRVGSTAWQTGDPPKLIYIQGVTNDPITDALVLPFVNGVSASAAYQQRANKAAAGGGAVGIFSRSDNGDPCGVRYDNGRYRVVSLPFELAGVSDLKDRHVLIRRALEWVGSCDLMVSSSYEGASPSVGTNSFWKNTSVDCHVTNALVSAGSTQYMCAGWSGSGSVSAGGSGTSTVFTLTNNSGIAWLWTTNYLLTVTADDHGTVDSAGGWKASGSNIPVLATATNYYHFSFWTGDVASASASNNPLSVVMDGPRSIEALFEENLATNGTPEWWLASYGWTNNFDAAATNDADADGMATWEEWVSLTDPTNRFDCFKIDEAACVPGGYVVSWTCHTGRTYDVSWFTNFVSEASVLGSNIVYPQSSYTDTVNTSQSRIFYRVRVRE